MSLVAIGTLAESLCMLQVLLCFPGGSRVASEASYRRWHMTIGFTERACAIVTIDAAAINTLVLDNGLDRRVGYYGFPRLRNMAVIAVIVRGEVVCGHTGGDRAIMTNTATRRRGAMPVRVKTCHTRLPLLRAMTLYAIFQGGLMRRRFSASNIAIVTVLARELRIRMRCYHHDIDMAFTVAIGHDKFSDIATHDVGIEFWRGGVGSAQQGRAVFGFDNHGPAVCQRIVIRVERI